MKEESEKERKRREGEREGRVDSKGASSSRSEWKREERENRDRRLNNGARGPGYAKVGEG